MDEQACWKQELEKVTTKFDPSKKKKKKKKPFIREDATYYDRIGYQKEGHSSEDDDAPHFQSGRILLREPDYGYAELLSRVLREVNLEVSSDRPRTLMMRPQLMSQGTHVTVCLDFAHLCRMMHRKPGHVLNFLLGQMETKGSFNKQQQLEMMGLVSSQDFHTVFRKYIDAFVICSCCKSPDTALAEDNGISTLSCEMCGFVASINQPSPL